MAHSDGIYWYDPDPRAILPIDTFTVPRRLARTVRSGRFDIRVDSDFRAVIEACAAPDVGREDTWISPELIDLYTELHTLALPIVSRPGTQGNWSVAYMAWLCVACSLGRACLAASLMRAKSHWCILSNGYSVGATSCWMCSLSPPIWLALAQSKSHAHPTGHAWHGHYRLKPHSRFPDLWRQAYA